MATGRMAFTFLREGLKFRAGRLYETFWNSQSNVKYTLVFLYPAYLYSTRWRAETSYKYRVYIADKSLEPGKKTDFFGWWNGWVFYQPATATVQDIKKAVLGEDAPENVRVGCHGRMMENSDNLALAVRTFCKRDPMLLFWQEETQAA